MHRWEMPGVVGTSQSKGQARMESYQVTFTEVENSDVFVKREWEDFLPSFKVKISL